MFLTNIFAARLIQPIGVTNNQISTNVNYNSFVSQNSNQTDLSLVASNAIKLNNSASSQDGYYDNYRIIVTKVLQDQSQVVQQRLIQSYVGSTRTAVVTQSWQSQYIPDQTFTYVIVPKNRDSRVSINTAIQTLDYLTSQRYGRGLSYQQDLQKQSWLSSARDCDIQSNVTVLSPNHTGVQVGSTYQYRPNGRLVFQGTVKQTSDNYITFQKVLGKLTNKWLTWKRYQIGDIIYTTGRLYQVTVNSTISQPRHSSGQVSGAVVLNSLQLQKVQGIGSQSIQLNVSENPVQGLSSQGVKISGYSLYDADGVNYYRLLGWDQHSQRNATTHQTNITIDTSQPLFQNTNNLLQHCGGILRYSQGKYALQIQKIQTQFINIQQSNIIGTITLQNQGLKKSINSLTVAYSDPSNRYQALNISFGNSRYLKQDRNVPRKGNLTIPGITNYYNTRLMADRFLQRSRKTLVISMKLQPVFIKLQAGNIIRLTYPRYNWINKQFRIQTLTLQNDTLISVQAQQYSPLFYSASNIGRQAGVGLSSGTTQRANIQPPTNLSTTSQQGNNQQKGRIQLSWINNPKLIGAGAFTQILRSNSSKYELAVKSLLSNNVLEFNQTHQLLQGDLIQINSTNINELNNHKFLYVSRVISNTKITLATTLQGSQIQLPLETSPLIKVITALPIAQVAIPKSTYTDIISQVSQQRISRNYWVRHKISQ